MNPIMNISNSSEKQLECCYLKKIIKNTLENKFFLHVKINDSWVDLVQICKNVEDSAEY